MCAPNAADVRHQAAFELVEKHQRRAARQQIAAVGASVIAECGRCGDPLGEERRRNRNACTQRFADRHQIRLQPDLWRAKCAPCPAQAALDLVGDHQRAGRTARIHNRRGHGAADRPHASFALYRLDDDRSRDGR